MKNSSYFASPTRLATNKLGPHLIVFPSWSTVTFFNETDAMHDVSHIKVPCGNAMICSHNKRLVSPTMDTTRYSPAMLRTRSWFGSRSMYCLATTDPTRAMATSRQLCNILLNIVLHNNYTNKVLGTLSCNPRAAYSSGRQI